MLSLYNVLTSVSQCCLMEVLTVVSVQCTDVSVTVLSDGGVDCCHCTMC